MGVGNQVKNTECCCVGQWEAVTLSVVCCKQENRGMTKENRGKFLEACEDYNKKKSSV